MTDDQRPELPEGPEESGVTDVDLDISEDDGRTDAPSGGDVGGPLSKDRDDEAFERRDERWTDRGNIRSWMILAFMVAAYLVWTGIIYFFEPGIR